LEVIIAYLFAGAFASAASAICLIPLFLSIKHREKGRQKADFLSACIWSGAFALIFLVVTELYDYMEWIFLWPVLAMLTSVLLILYTVSILSKKRVVVPLWSLGISGPTLLLRLGLNMRLISDGVAAHIMLILGIYPLYVIISIVALFVMLMVKRRQTKRLDR